MRLEDRAQETVVKLCDKEILLREREQKRVIEEARRLVSSLDVYHKMLMSRFQEKERKAAEKAEKEAAKRIPPQEMFCRGDEGKKYSKWDENGIPTHTADGEEVFQSFFFSSIALFISSLSRTASCFLQISKKQRKKLEKIWETQQKNYQQAMAAEG